MIVLKLSLLKKYRALFTSDIFYELFSGVLVRTFVNNDTNIFISEWLTATVTNSAMHCDKDTFFSRNIVCSVINH